MARRLGRVRDEDFDRTATLIATSFSVSPGDEREWLESAGHDNIRVLRDGGEPVAALITIPMGQFFGGRSVPMVGIAGVACPPELRGTGAATEMMKQTMRELGRGGVPLSGLYPAVQSVYRRAGFELAGTHFETAVDSRDLGDGDRTLPVRPYTDDDEPAVKKLYAEASRWRNGRLDRGPYVWRRVRKSRHGPSLGYVVEERGAITGYVFFRQQRRPGQHLFLETVVTCMAFASDASRRRLLTLLGDLRSLNDEVRFFGAAFDDFLVGLEERRYRIRNDAPYMLRIVDVASALEARGYSKAVDAELHLEVKDDVLRQNAGRHRVRVSGGRADVREGGRGALKLDVRALAQLYSGFASPFALAGRGAIEGKPRDLDIAAGIFAGAEPAVPDMF